MRVISIITVLSALLVGELATAVKDETKTIDQLYQDAVKEGGKLVFYHGGDTPTQQDQLKNQFIAAFPKINLTMIVDYSKYHDVRIDNQLERNALVPDVVALQTLQNFPRWTKEDKLLKYKPANFTNIYEGFKDPNGAWFGYRIFAFSFAANSTSMGGLPIPATPLQIADPKYKGHIASSYPHDDDAALFTFVSYVEKYGWDWAAKLATQEIEFNRGSHIANQRVNGGLKGIGMGTSSPYKPALDGNYPFLAWGQRVAILKKAKNVAAAKLLMNWLATEDMQRRFGSSGWTVRKDLAPTNGYDQVWKVPQANVAKFDKFMADRERVEMWKQTFAIYFGEVRGEPTPGSVGVFPGKQ